MSETPAKTPTERISTALRAAAKHGQPALVAFLTAGYPDRARVTGLAIRTRDALPVGRLRIGPASPADPADSGP